MLKLLIADDEKIIRETVAALIDWDSLGIQLIGTAKDGIEAYNMILDEYPDIVLTDIKMPGLSGLELIQKIQEINKDTRFIILSGYGEFAYAKQAMAFGVRHYLLKPCNEEQIIDSLLEVAGECRTSVSGTLMSSLLSNCLIPDNPSGVLAPYRNAIDFDATAYTVFYIYYLLPANRDFVLRRLFSFLKDAYPSVHFYMVYVQNTLLFFCDTDTLDRAKTDAFLLSLNIPQPVSCQTSSVSCKNLSCALKELVSHLKKYERIFFSDGAAEVTIFNYKNIIQEVRRMTESLYASLEKDSLSVRRALLDTLNHVSDVDFLRQLVSSVIIFSVSKIDSFDMVQAAGLLTVLAQESDCDRIVAFANAKITEFLEEYHSHSYAGNISLQIKKYVEENLPNSELSLKWIAENYLFMNVDYLSKRFLKETGQKFSHYLTDTRVRRAKELMGLAKPYSIQEIADLVGCGNNPQYFSQIFKKTTGMTPSRYKTKRTSPPRTP